MQELCSRCLHNQAVQRELETVAAQEDVATMRLVSMPFAAISDEDVKKILPVQVCKLARNEEKPRLRRELRY